MSDEKLSGGGRPESRERFDKWFDDEFGDSASNGAHRESHFRTWQAGERDMAERAAKLEKALAEFVHWLEDDTLEIMRDTLRMGITFDWKDCELLQEQIEKAKRALADVPATLPEQRSMTPAEIENLSNYYFGRKK